MGMVDFAPNCAIVARSTNDFEGCSMYGYKGLVPNHVINASAIYAMTYIAACAQLGVESSIKGESVATVCRHAVGCFTMWYSAEQERLHPVLDFCEAYEQVASEYLAEATLVLQASAGEAKRLQLFDMLHSAFDEVITKDAEAYLYSEVHMLMPLVCLATRTAFYLYVAGARSVEVSHNTILQRLTQVLNAKRGQVVGGESKAVRIVH